MNGCWNLWHGCEKYSEGCKNCYVYRRDGSVGRDASAVFKTAAFDMPIKRGRDGKYKVKPGENIYVCMTSDFFLDKADEWRGEAWDMIRERPDVYFTIITKRIVRFMDCAPSDWGGGWDNVRVVCTVENQRQADIRLPVFACLPIRRKAIACEPLLGDIELEKYLLSPIELIVAGGESGQNARLCDYSWVLHLREQAERRGLGFWFKQTGANFQKDGKRYAIPRKLQSAQARKAGLNI